MLTVLLVIFGSFGTWLVLLAPVLVRLLKRCPAEEITEEWLSSFSPATYRPMHGLLADDDFKFLARQPGFDLSLYRKLRRERMLIFRQYLRCLINDFNKLHTYTRFVIAHSETDRSDLMMQLASLKFKFALSVTNAELSYYLCLVGVGSLATRAVVARLEELNSHLSLNNPQHFLAH